MDKQSIHPSHTLYQRKDFTDEEIARDNVLAVAVLKDKKTICKQCGQDTPTILALKCGDRLAIANDKLSTKWI